MPPFIYQSKAYNIIALWLQSTNGILMEDDHSAPAERWTAALPVRWKEVLHPLLIIQTFSEQAVTTWATTKCWSGSNHHKLREGHFALMPSCCGVNICSYDQKDRTDVFCRRRLHILARIHFRYSWYNSKPHVFFLTLHQQRDYAEYHMSRAERCHGKDATNCHWKHLWVRFSFCV